jgi:glutamate racemase
VEEGWVGKPESNMILKKYLTRVKRKMIDTLILGCTHYSFLEKDIARIMGKNCRVLNGPETISRKLADYLIRHPEIEVRIPQNRTVTYCTTDDPHRFRIFGEKFLNQNIPSVEKIVMDPQGLVRI